MPWRYVLWPWGAVLVSLLVSLCGCREEPIVLGNCTQNQSFLPGSKREFPSSSASDRVDQAERQPNVRVRRSEGVAAQVDTPSP